MPKTIGIVGGGQLGRMLTEAALKLGYEVCVIDPTPDCPARQVGARQIVADYKDSEALDQLASESDYVTIEFEHINADVLDRIAKDKPVNPAPDTIKLIQDKYLQKKFFSDRGFLTADFLEINDQASAEEAFDKWGPFIIKSKTESFDGRGNIFITEKSQISQAFQKFSQKQLYGEKLIDFKIEIAVMVAKDIKGEILTYPAVRTVHERNICTEVYAPAEIEADIARKARDIARDAVSKLEGAGMYGVELFLDNNDDILINEIAPRVHNSGHYSMDFCDVSQFTQHILAISGQELQTPVVQAKACCMINILGVRDGPVELEGVDEAENIPGVNVYIYGKAPTKIDRKMGHINAIAGTMKEAKEKAEKARKLISI